MARSQLAAGAEERLARRRGPGLNRDPDGDVIGLTRAYHSLLRSLVQRCGGCLALAALLLQVGLSFGHFHARDFRTYDLAGQSAAYTAQQTVRTTAQAFLERSSKLVDDDDQCPICFSSSLLASSFIPDTPRPAIPIDFRDVGGAVARPDRLAPEAHHAAFQPRGPPIA
jgi:hypothetical protein